MHGHGSGRGGRPDRGFGRERVLEVISKLENDGYVRRTIDPEDKRATLIMLTELGEARTAELQDEKNDTLDKIFGNLSDDEKEQAHSTARKTDRSVTENCPSVRLFIQLCRLYNKTVPMFCQFCVALPRNKIFFCVTIFSELRSGLSLWQASQPSGRKQMSMAGMLLFFHRKEEFP